MAPATAPLEGGSATLGGAAAAAPAVAPLAGPWPLAPLAGQPCSPLLTGLPSDVACGSDSMAQRMMAPVASHRRMASDEEWGGGRMTTGFGLLGGWTAKNTRPHE